MTAIAERASTALALPEADLLRVLKSSLYPGASDDSIRLVVSYCKASNLDPMQKPVHIVPMWDSKAKAMRDVVMPGVNLYRTQAARSGQFAGMSEPEFGPDVSKAVGAVPMIYPEWCRVTVKRALASGIVAEFTALEYWSENYATKGGAEKSAAPNAMWQRRPRGQLAKCASAQALRIAFPELASPPTADEMEGKTMHAEGEALVDISSAVPLELMEEARNTASFGVANYQKFWQAISPVDRKILGPHHADLKAAAEKADRERTVDAGVPDVTIVDQPGDGE